MEMDEKKKIISGIGVDFKIITIKSLMSLSALSHALE